MTKADIMRKAMQGEHFTPEEVAETYADRDNWQQIHDKEGCHWCWVGPVTVGWELASWAVKEK